MSHIFISYATEDSEYVSALENALRENDYDVWRDKTSMQGGAHWEHEIKSAITQAYAVIIIMTPKAEASEWVTLEKNYAQELKKPIIPLLLRGNVWFSLSSRQYIDGTGPESDKLAPSALYPALLEHAPHQLDSQMEAVLQELDARRGRLIQELQRLASNPYSPRSHGAREWLQKLSAESPSETHRKAMSASEADTIFHRIFAAPMYRMGNCFALILIVSLSAAITWFVTRSTITPPTVPPLQEIFPQAITAEYFSFYGNGASLTDQFSAQCAYAGGYGLNLRYAMSGEAYGGWGVHWDNTPNTYLDASNFTGFTFWVKGSARSETFQIGLKDTTQEVKLESKDFVTVSSNEWKQVTVRFRDFAGIVPAQIKNVNLGFHAGHGTGTICIDDIAFIR